MEKHDSALGFHPHSNELDFTDGARRCRHNREDVTISSERERERETREPVRLILGRESDDRCLMRHIYTHHSVSCSILFLIS